LKNMLLDFELVRFCSKEELTLDNIKELNPKYIFFPHWSWMIPEDVFSQYECVIFHMTDLPYGRGGSPLQNLIVRGHEKTMVTGFRCVSELDAGPIYLKRSMSLVGTADEVLFRASNLMEKMIVEIVKNHPVPVEQQGTPTFFSRRGPEDGNLAKLDGIKEAHDFVRMLDGEGYPPAFVETEYLRFEFSDAKLTSDSVVADVRIIMKK